MNEVRRGLRELCAVCARLFVGFAMQAGRGLVPLLLLHASAAFADPGAAPLQLQWETVHIGASADAPRSEARFVLTNRDARPLPEKGWSIYFNCLADVETGSTPGHVTIERVSGGLFRMRPAAGFKALASGASVRSTPFISAT